MPQNPSEAPVRFSHLKRMAQSPAHYLSSLTEDRDSAPMRLGRLVHTLCLGGESFAVYEGERRGNAWKEFALAHAAVEIVTRSELDKATAIADSVREAIEANPEARLLLKGDCEREVAWTHETGRKCLSHIDVLGIGHLTELKTGATAEPGRFGRMALRMGYHAQLAFYQDAVRCRTLPAYIVAAETAPPFAVTVFQLTDRALDEGRKLCRLWMEQLLNCERANAWPPYCQSIVPLDIAEDVGLIIDGEEVAA